MAVACEVDDGLGVSDPPKTDKGGSKVEKTKKKHNTTRPFGHKCGPNWELNPGPNTYP